MELEQAQAEATRRWGWKGVAMVDVNTSICEVGHWADDRGAGGDFVCAGTGKTWEEAFGSSDANGRLMMVRQQVLSRDCVSLTCPYCLGKSHQTNRTFCCDELRHAVIAILSGERALKTAEAAEKAMQN